MFLVETVHTDCMVLKWISFDIEMITIYQSYRVNE